VHLAGDRSSPSRHRRHRPALLVAYVLAGALGALGGARPTGIAWLDAMLLGLGGAAAAACAVRSRTIPVYVAAGLAAALQPATVPLVLGGLGLAAAFARRFRRSWTLAGAASGGLAWAAAVGAPFEPGARLLYLPMAALTWTAWSARRHASRRFRRRFDQVALATAGLAVVAGALGTMSAITARIHLTRGVDLLQAGLTAAREGDTEGAVADLRAARQALGRGEDALGAVWARAAWALPGASQNLRALHSTVAEVGELADAGIRAGEEADVESLRARHGQVDLAAVASMEAPLADVLATLQRTDVRVAELTDAWLLPPVRSRLEDLRDELADALPSAELALRGVRAAPGLLGGEGQRTYLALFTTPVEARATTGFPGNFAELTFTNGRFEMTRFGRISDLVAGLPDGGGTITGPADYLIRYGRFGPTREWRNITLSPDFPTVAAVAAELYPQSGGRPVDGVLSLDPVALAGLLQFTGPIAVPGVSVPLGPDNAAKYLLLDQYIELPDVPDRIDALELLAKVAVDRLLASDLPGPRTLSATLGPIVEQGHLQLATFDSDEADFLDRLGISGRYPAVDGDFVGVTTSNAGAGKIDLFMRRALDYDVTWDPSTGALTATATVTLTNQAPASGLPDYVIGNLLGRRLGETSYPAGWNNTFLTLYSPWEAETATLDGEPLGLERNDELGRHAYSTFVPIAPGATRTLVIELHGSLTTPDYRLGLATQPLVQPEQVSVRVQSAGADRLTSTGPLEPHGSAVEGTFPLVADLTIVVTRQ
jgi:hypothetical protein